MKKIEDRVIKEFGTKKNFLAIFVFGSTVRGNADQYSDIDFLVLLKKKYPYSRKSFFVEGVRADVLFETKRDMNKYLAEEKNNVRRISSHMLAHSRILFTRDGSEKKMQVLAKQNLKGKTKYTRSEILMHLYSIDDFLSEVRRDEENDDRVAFDIDSHLLINNSIELLLKLSGEYLRQPKEMRIVLEKIDPEFLSLLERFYEMRSLADKVRILVKLTEYSYKKAGGPLPDEWMA